MPRLLWIRTDRLGETLLNLPALTALKAGQSGVTVTMLVHETIAPLIRTVPAVDEVWVKPPSSRGWWARTVALARQVRAGRFDAAVASNAAKDVHLALALAGVPVRVGYDRKWGCLLTRRVPDLKARGDRHEVDCNLDLVRALGLPTGAPGWPDFQLDGPRRDVDRFLADQAMASSEPFVAVHPWTSNPVKQWAFDRFRRVVQAVTDGPAGAPVVIIGGAAEAGRMRALWPDPSPRVIDAVGRLGLPQTAALLRRARLLLSNDSGPVHLAAAVRTPTVALFGGTDAAVGPVRWGPWGAGHAVVRRTSMDAITIEDVLAAMRPLLA